MSPSDIEKAIGYAFKDKSLLERALTLPSASAESNQQLEFFGDAILEFIVSEKLYFSGAREGELTERRKSLVSDTALAPVSEKLGLDKCLIRGKNDTNNKKAIPSAYEAVVAAVYLDGGMDAAKKFVLSTLGQVKNAPAVNYKGQLQELLQSMGKPRPEYSHEDKGTQKKHAFIVKAEVFGKVFTAEAETVKNAEQLAAEKALSYYKNKPIQGK